MNTTIKKDEAPPSGGYLLGEGDFGTWAFYLLYYEPAEQCWVIDCIVRRDEPFRDQANPALTSPHDHEAARQWACTALAPNASGIIDADEVSTWTITEWCLVDADGRTGWTPLYDLSDVTHLPFAPTNPDTGSRTDPVTDNRLRALHNRGRTSAHPIGTQLLRATDQGIDSIAWLFGDTFADLPQAAWLVPDDRRRRDVLSAYAAITVAHAITSGHGHVDIIREHDIQPLLRTRHKHISAAAVWLYHDEKYQPPADYPAQRRRACQQWERRFAVLDADLARYHEPKPHHHLAFLAVAGHRRRSGLGSVLMRSHLALLKASGGIVYAPAASPNARAFYRRHGLHHRLPFPLPPAGIRQPAGQQVWPCTRKLTAQGALTGSDGGPRLGGANRLG